MASGVDYKTLVDVRPVGSELVVSDFFDIPGAPGPGTVTYRTIELPLNVVTPPSATDPVYVREVHPTTHVPLGPIFTMVLAPAVPIAGEFQVDAQPATNATFVLGTLVFNQADNGKTLEIIYTGRGTLVFASDVQDARDELKLARDTYFDLDTRLDAIASGAGLTYPLTMPGDVTIGGSLTVTGATVFNAPETVLIEDNIILLNSNVTGAPSEDAGIEVERGTETNVSLLWREGTDNWELTGGGLTFTGDLNITGDIIQTGNQLLTGYSDYIGIAAPALSNADEGRLYYDLAANSLKLSEDGGAYTDVITVGGGGLIGSGTTGKLSKWATSSTLTDSVIVEASGNIGIGVTPTVKLEVLGGILAANDGFSFRDNPAMGMTRFGGILTISSGTAQQVLTVHSSGTYLGGSSSGAPLSFQALRATSASGANVAGSAMYFYSGQSTGNMSNSSPFSWFASSPGASGSGSNPLNLAMNLATDGAGNSFFHIRSIGVGPSATGLLFHVGAATASLQLSSGNIYLDNNQTGSSINIRTQGTGAITLQSPSGTNTLVANNAGVGIKKTPASGTALDILGRVDVWGSGFRGRIEHNSADFSMSSTSGKDIRLDSSSGYINCRGHITISSPSFAQNFKGFRLNIHDSWGGNAGTGISLGRSPGGWNQLLTANFEISQIVSRIGDGNDDLTIGAKILTKLDGTASVNRAPTEMSFWTAAGASDDDLAQRLTITKDGEVGIGTVSPLAGYKLHTFGGHIRFDSGITGGNQVDIMRGSALKIFNSNNLSSVTLHHSTANLVIQTQQGGIQLLPNSGPVEIGGQVKITGGAPGAAKVLTDVGGTGLATWETPSGGGGHTIEDEGTPVAQQTNMDFVGPGVTVADSGGKTVVTIPGSAGTGHTVQDEGSPVVTRTNMNFVGAGVAVSDGGAGPDSTIVTIPGNEGNLSGEAFIGVVKRTVVASSSESFVIDGTKMYQLLIRGDWNLPSGGVILVRFNGVSTGTRYMWANVNGTATTAEAIQTSVTAIDPDGPMGLSMFIKPTSGDFTPGMQIDGNGFFRTTSNTPNRMNYGGYFHSPGPAITSMQIVASSGTFDATFELLELGSAAPAAPPSANRQNYVATALQTVFALADFTFVADGNSLIVVAGGVVRTAGVDYIEDPSGTFITFITGRPLGQQVSLILNGGDSLARMMAFMAMSSPIM